MGIKVLMDDSMLDDRLWIQFYNDNHKRQHVFMLGERFQISKTRVGPALCPLQRNMGPLWPSTRCTSKCSLNCVRQLFHPLHTSTLCYTSDRTTLPTTRNNFILLNIHPELTTARLHFQIGSIPFSGTTMDSV